MAAVSVVVLLGLVAEVGAPSPAKAKAQSLLSMGTVLYEHGDYQGALDRFKQAYAAFPSSKLWFNIAQAQRLLGHRREAMQAFQRFVASSAEASPDDLAVARILMDDLRSQLGQLRVDCDAPGVAIALDGTEVGHAPWMDDLWVEPGTHTLTARGSSGTTPFIVNVLPGTSQFVTLKITSEEEMAAKEEAPPPIAVPRPAQESKQSAHAMTPRQPSYDPWWLRHKWAWVAVGTAVVTAMGATTVAAIVQSRYAELDRSCGSASPNRDGCSQDEMHSQDGLKTTANFLWVAAGAAAVGAGVLFVVGGKSVTVAPTVGSTKVGVQARLMFP